MMRSRKTPFSIHSINQRKLLLTVRVDSDMLAWLKSQGKGYQTRINAILRDATLRSMR
ncbi:BrnA antitoxin family protein [Bartonella grahamii]|uniref:BrnA antitoxin family protein n=1 Tax=Bartonella grahamii TaxID=33045 RepID=UPI001FD8EA9F|nr:BrnA antitoxin family protein [Bartonella grahamii]